MGGMTLKAGQGGVLMGLQARPSGCCGTNGSSNRTAVRAHPVGRQHGPCSWARPSGGRHVELTAALGCRIGQTWGRGHQRWLEGQPWWRQWAMTGQGCARLKEQHSWAIERSCLPIRPTGLGIWRGSCRPNGHAPRTTPRLGLVRCGDVVEIGGRLDHSAGWGQGLRFREVGLGRVVCGGGCCTGAVEVHATGHHGLMRGLAGEWSRASARLGRPLAKPCGGIGQVPTRPRHVARP